MSPAKRKTLLGRPPEKDRGKVRSELVQVKLTPPEADTLDRLVDLRRAEIEAAHGGARLEFTRSSLVRELIQAEAARRKLAGGSR